MGPGNLFPATTQHEGKTSATKPTPKNILKAANLCYNIYTASSQRLLAQSAPGSGGSLHEHHFCPCLVEAPGGGDHPNTFLHSPSLRGAAGEQTPPKVPILRTCANSTWGAAKSPPEAGSSLAQPSLSRQVPPQRAEDLCLRAGLCYWYWLHPPHLQSSHHRMCGTVSSAL